MKYVEGSKRVFLDTGIRFQRRIVQAIGIIKVAAARTNVSLGLLDRPTGEAIVKAGEEVVAGGSDDLGGGGGVLKGDGGGGKKKNHQTNTEGGGRPPRRKGGDHRPPDKRQRVHEGRPNP